MSPDDPRHGTPRGYRLHREISEDACDRCATAWYRYNKHATYLRVTGKARRVPSIGAHRRIRALMALGYGLPCLAAELGIATGNLSYKLQQPYVVRDTHEAIAALFDRLAMQPPPTGWIAQRTRNIARKNTWPPPLAWDDETIDDPDAQPYASAPRDRGRPDMHRIEDLEWLADSDENLTNAAERLGLKPDSVRDECRRAGRMDLYWRLANREPNAEHRRASGAGTRRAKGAA